MSIQFTKNSNKSVNNVLKDKIVSTAKDYCENGLLNIGYTLHSSDRRYSYYTPDNELPALVICSVNNDIVDTYDIYQDAEHTK
ncbi:hypothetical protein [Clostridium sp. OS1-26]|uniref:hypothetical protein n=1 Tax=Clostridium sp. OS1-26 TaxID=3070681 RepID=UPI0027DFAF63|nr:hypothetical protein [Clostridium sp. OS1-26]WML36948.1 hypothetical protein RCG18_10195 [Clostridium sp. OS1-26]